MEWTVDDRIALRRAKALLEHPGLGVRIANTIGAPVEKLLTALPEGASTAIHTATTKSLDAALRVATSLMDDQPRPALERLHSVAVAATGAAGGAFGLAALAAELPISTTIMLRSIADIARSEGHPIRSHFVQMSCLQVFALGGPARRDDASEAGYFAIRAALARAVSEAAEHLATRGLAAESAPPLLRLVTRIGARFGIPVTEKVMAQSVPLIGAAGGAMINVLFIRHFQDVARGHFTVLRLEAAYGPDEVKAAYAAV
jgi:hypothetical protein